MKKLLASFALIALLTAGASVAQAQTADDLNKTEADHISSGQMTTQPAPQGEMGTPGDMGKPMGEQGHEHHHWHHHCHHHHCHHHHGHHHHGHHHHHHHDDKNGMQAAPADAPVAPPAQ